HQALRTASRSRANSGSDLFVLRDGREKRWRQVLKDCDCLDHSWRWWIFRMAQAEDNGVVQQSRSTHLFVASGRAERNRSFSAARYATERRHASDRNRQRFCNAQRGPVEHNSARFGIRELEQLASDASE